MPKPSNIIADMFYTPTISGSKEILSQIFNKSIFQIHEEMEKGIDFANLLKLIDKKSENLLKLLKTYFYHKSDSVDCKLVILKILNLLIAKYHFLRKDSALLSRPFGILVDPSNGCNLHCPGCVHSKTAPADFIWPSGIMSEKLFSDFIDTYGPYAFKIGLYSYGEPLLNRLTPLFIRLSKSYLLETFLSTNLSLKIDADDIVLSGLDYLIISVDGVTQESYEKYRKGGRLNVIMDNIQKLVEAKRRHQSSTPYLVWQFLLFEHNKHEISLAKELASNLGVDELHLMTPYSVNWDDPAIVVNETHEDERFYFPQESDKGIRHLPPTKGASFQKESNVNSLFSLKWHDQYRNSIQPQNSNDSAEPDKFTCAWLYKGIVMDAVGRIMPCCGAPTTSVNLVYSQFKEGVPPSSASGYNSDLFRLSRQFFSNNERYQETSANLNKNQIPYCSECTWNKDTFFTNKGDLVKYFRSNHLFSILNDESIIALTDW